MVTAVQLGSGEFKYEVAVDWETIPDGYQWREVAGVIADANDNVYVFNRGPHPMIVFDKDGNFIKSWGEDVLFGRMERLRDQTTPCISLTMVITLFGSAHWMARC